MNSELYQLTKCTLTSRERYHLRAYYEHVAADERYALANEDRKTAYRTFFAKYAKNNNH